MTRGADTAVDVALEAGARRLRVAATDSRHERVRTAAIGRAGRGGEAGDLAVKAVLADVVRRPRHHLVARWNWKAAFVSGVVRGLLFLAMTRGSGVEAAGAALGVEFAYRVASTGGWSALTQAFRRATPGWAAGLVVMVAIPVTAHALEFGVHLLAGTVELGRAMVASMALTVVSAAFTLFAMRRGVLIVGDADRRPFRRDIAALPGLVADFFIAIGSAVDAGARRFAASAGRARLYVTGA